MQKICRHCQSKFEITQDDNCLVFDQWNNLKKKVHNKKYGGENFIHEREIYFAFLGQNIGLEQNGKGEEFLRPVIIFKKLNNHIFLVIPLTKTFREGSFYYSFKFSDEGISTAVLAQIKVIDKKRLHYKAGKINKNDFEKLKNKLRTLLSF